MTSVTGTTDHTSQDPQQISEKARKAREPVKRANFSNLPEKLRPDRLSQDADLLDDEQLFFPKSAAEKQQRIPVGRLRKQKNQPKPKLQNFFMPWESEQQDLDPATNDVIGDDGEAQTFDLLADREYEPLDEHRSPEKKRVQAYLQQQTYSLDFDSYLKRFRDEEKLGLIDKDGIIVKGTAFKDLGASDSEESSEDDEDSEEAKGPRKKSSQFRVNTS